MDAPERLDVGAPRGVANLCGRRTGVALKRRAPLLKAAQLPAALAPLVVAFLSPNPDPIKVRGR